MNTDLRRFAPVGLILAAASILAAIGFYIYRGHFSTEVQICVGLIIVGLAIYILLDPDHVRTLLAGRQARYGSNALVLTLAFIGILVVVNVIVYQYNKRWDLTQDKTFTLAPETIDTLKKLPDTVNAQAFYSSQSSPQTAKDLLEQYKNNSDGKFTYEFIDPNQDPVAAQKAGITQDAIIVLNMSGHSQQVRFASEQELDSGLVRLMNPNAYTVYFLSGHGERSLTDPGQESYSQLKGTLEGKNYTVKDLNLLTTGKAPEDAKLVVIGGPKNPLTDAEVSTLKDFVANGGGLIVMEEPRILTDFGDAPDPLQAYLKDTWGIQLGEDLVFDYSYQNQLTMAVSAAYGKHSITDPIQNQYTLFPTSRSVTASTDAKTGVSLVELVKTAPAPQSWGETNLKDLQGDNAQVPQPDQGQDLMGPVSIAVAGENLESHGRVVVFGDADFIINAMFNAYGNSDLMVNAVDWTVGQENLINLTPKQTTNRVILPPGRVSLYLLYIGSACVLPLIAMIGGIVVFVQRRRRG